MDKFFSDFWDFCVPVTWAVYTVSSMLSFIPHLLPSFPNESLKSIILLLLFFWDGVSLCPSGWSSVVQTQLTAISTSQVQVTPLPQPPMYWDYRYGPPRLANVLYLVEMGFHHVGRMVSISWPCNPAASSSLSAGFTGVSCYGLPLDSAFLKVSFSFLLSRTL